MKKKIHSIFLTLLCVLFVSPLFLGCARHGVSHKITNYPAKLVYQVGETPNFDGLRIETINNDGTHTYLHFSNEDISDVDTSTPGEKKVKIEKGNVSVSFQVYVANVTVNDSDNLKDIFAGLNDGDIVYLREGNYAPKGESDSSYKNIVVDKSIMIIGDGRDKTKIAGNFIVGATYQNGIFTKIDNFKNVMFMDIGFKLDNQIKNGVVNYGGLYKNFDPPSAINLFDTSNAEIIDCSFEGYGYGVLGNSIVGLNVINNTFKKIFHTAINVTKDIQNSSIVSNLFSNIATNVVAFNGGFQSWTGGVNLHFASDGQKGVIIAKNNFNGIGAHNGDFIFFDESSKTQAQNTSSGVAKMYYMNNTSAVILLSSTQDDLAVNGIILSSNNYTGVFESLYMGVQSQNTINQNGVVLAE